MNIFRIAKVVATSTTFLFIFISILYIVYQKGLLKHLSVFNEGYRLTAIENSDKTFIKTKHYLLKTEFFSDKIEKQIEKISPIENTGDDIGVYYYIPLLKNTFNFKNNRIVYLLFFTSIILIGYIIAIIGFNLILRNKFVLFIAIILTGIFSLFLFFIMDVYVLTFFVVSFVPLFMFILKEIQNIKFIKLIIFFSFLGFLIGFANEFRIGSGSVILVFIFLSFSLYINKLNWGKILSILLVLIISSYIEKVHFKYLKYNRDKWLFENDYSDQIIKKDSKHLFWHPLYLGLGFIPNKYGIIWADNFAYNKVRNKGDIEMGKNLNLNNYGDNYDNFIKNEYINILKNDPFFIFKTFVLKFIYVILFLSPFFNFGFILIFRIKLNYKILIPLLVSIVFSILPGVFVWPYPMYFLASMFLTLILSLLYIEKYFEK